MFPSASHLGGIRKIPANSDGTSTSSARVIWRGGARAFAGGLWHQPTSVAVVRRRQQTVLMASALIETRKESARESPATRTRIGRIPGPERQLIRRLANPSLEAGFSPLPRHILRLCCACDTPDCSRRRNP